MIRFTRPTHVCHTVPCPEHCFANDLVQIAGQNFCSEELDRSVFRKSFQRTKRTVVLGVLNKRNFISNVSIELF